MTGDLDIAIANGHVMANVSLLRGGGKFAQRNLLLRNSDGRFQNVTDQAGPGFSIELVSRALAVGDVDNDGDLDLLVTNNGAGVNLLLNEGRAEAGARANAMLVRVIGTKSNRSGIGTRLTLTTGGRRQLREVQSGSSYLTQNDLRAHFGLGAANRSERLEIRWPSGATEVVRIFPPIMSLRCAKARASLAACRSAFADATDATGPALQAGRASGSSTAALWLGVP